MPTTKSAPDGNVASTRQMLDELDALMERMLALPVNDLDELAREPLPRPTLTATLTVIETAEPELTSGEAPAVPAVSQTESVPVLENPAWTSPPPEETTVPAATQTPTGPNYQWELPPTADLAQESLPPVMVPPTPIIEPLRAPRRSFVGWLLSPLVAFNRAFDGWLEPLGGLGRWFRRPAGRFVLGLAGLGMLAGALLWVIRDLASWTR